MKLISIVTPCFNEEENVKELYEQVRAVFDGMPQYEYEHIFIDNASKDKTVQILKNIAKEDKNVKIIVNTRNFGWLRSPNYALLQAKGDAVVALPADLQDPPVMIKDFIRKWEEGYKVVIGVKHQTEESFLMFFLRRVYYNLLNQISEMELVKNFSGFGLYDRIVIEIMRQINDPYPYFRGLISEIGYDIYKIEYKQAIRKHGLTSGTFYKLFDVAMLGITNYSKIPLRLATFFGCIMSVFSLLMAFAYLILKLAFWDQYPLGFASLTIGFFFFSSIQLFFIGMLGEYLSAIHVQILKRPLVIEKERVNFD